MSADYDVLLLGRLFCDLVFTDLPAMPELGREVFASQLDVAGGGSFIAAAAMHRLGLRVGLVADLGNDLFSQMVARLIEEEGLDTSLIRRHPLPLPQVTVALSFPDDRAFVTKINPPPSRPDMADLLTRHSARHLHIYSLGPGLDHPDLTRLAHDAGLTVSMDCGWEETRLRDPRTPTLIESVDVFLPSAAEACFLTNRPSPEAALQELAHRVPTVAVKLGGDGVIAQAGDHFEHVPALRVTPVDTTGAGDAFDAGFIYAYLKESSMRDCLRYGSVCGGLATTAPGGATAVPTLEEVDIWLSELP
jgi:sugar/nucleoside kinase (ribokinase family)